MLGESVPPTHHHTDIIRALITDVFDVTRVRFSIQPVLFRLWFDQVHLTLSSVHLELDNRCRFGRMVCLFWAKVESLRLRWGVCFRRCSEGRRTSKEVVTQQVCQRGTKQAVAGASEEIATCLVVVHSPGMLIDAAVSD